MKRVRTHKPWIRRDHPRHEVLPADPRDPDVLRAKALTRAQRAAPMPRMRELTDRSQAGGLPDVVLADYGLFHLEGDLP